MTGCVNPQVSERQKQLIQRLRKLLVDPLSTVDDGTEVLEYFFDKLAQPYLTPRVLAARVSAYVHTLTMLPSTPSQCYPPHTRNVNPKPHNVTLYTLTMLPSTPHHVTLHTLTMLPSTPHHVTLHTLTMLPSTPSQCYPPHPHNVTLHTPPWQVTILIVGGAPMGVQVCSNVFLTSLESA